MVTVKIKPKERVCLNCRWWGRSAECFYPMNGRSVQGLDFKDCQFFEPYVSNFFAGENYPFLKRDIGFFKEEIDNGE